MSTVGTITKWLGIGVYVICASLIVVFLMPVGGWKALNVLTGSMKPAIAPGDLVLVHRVPARDIRPGDIVTYTSLTNSKQTITHRVVSKQVIDRLPTITAKGDANDRADPPIPSGRVVGRVAVIIPAAGHLLGLLHNPFILLALVVIPGLIVIWAEIRSLRRMFAASGSRAGGSKASVERSDPPSEPPVGPLVVESRPKSRSRPQARSLDSMGPRLMLVVVGVILVATGQTYASNVGSVTLMHNTVTAVNNKSRAALLREAHRVFREAIHAANARLRTDIRGCLASRRQSLLGVNAVGHFDAQATRYEQQVGEAQNQFEVQALNITPMSQGSGVYSQVFESAHGAEVSSSDLARDQFTASMDRGASTGVRKKSVLSQCLTAAHVKHRSAVHAARDQLLATIRAIFHR